MSTDDPTLQDALDALTLAGPHLDAEAVEAVVRRFPEHARRIREEAMDLAVLALGGKASMAPTTPSAAAETRAETALAAFHRRLDALTEGPKDRRPPLRASR
ncbi:MAG: hypothetical protein AAGN66_26065 [Acidobacteriota bacterium]